jgi:hypothetical protein
MMGRKATFAGEKETPILFLAPMVRAIIAGTKTVTRRPVKRLGGIGNISEFHRSHTKGYDWIFRDRRGLWNDMRSEEVFRRCPYGAGGDLLWCRETWCPVGQSFIYRADGASPPEGERWHASILMPRRASRLTLKVVSVSLEQIRDITEDEARAEGVESRDAFHEAWNSIYYEKEHLHWNSNPWIWTIDFRKLP